MHVPIAASLLNIMRETFVSALQTAEKEKGVRKEVATAFWHFLVHLSTPQLLQTVERLRRMGGLHSASRLLTQD